MNTACNTLEKPTQKRFKNKRKWTPQLGKYNIIWAQIFDKFEWSNKPESEKKDLRHSINEDLFGSYVRPSEMNNEQWSIMFFALELLSERGILIWSKELAKYAIEEGRRRIYTWWIDNAGLDVEGVATYGAPEEYISAIARDRFHNITDWRSLDSDSLWQLFITIKNRVRKAKARGTSLWTTNQPAPENCPF